MGNAKLPILNIQKLQQVCIVVSSVEEKMKTLWETFGMGPWEYFTIKSHLNEEMFYYGKPTEFSMKVALLNKDGSDFELELIEPLDGDSTYRDFLRDHGEGVHHLGHYVVEDLEAFYKTQSELESMGCPCVTSARIGGTCMGYFDTTGVMNTMLEVVCYDPSVTLPFDRQVFPADT